MTSDTRALSGPAAWWDTLVAASQKELIIMTRYPVEFIASFAQVFLVVIVITLAGLMFAQGGAQAGGNSNTAGVVVCGFILYMFFEGTMWNIGYNVRREQKQGTLEQLYLSPATKSITLLSSITVMIVWRGLLCLGSALIMSWMLGRLPFHNPALSLLILALSLSGMFGAGFAFAALTLRVRETGQTIASFAQVAYMVLCAPFFPFAALPDWLKALARLLPFAYGVDAFRATLLDYPPGFPELAPLNVELVIITAFGLLMPVIGFWLYQREENRARAHGSLSEY